MLETVCKSREESNVAVSQCWTGRWGWGWGVSQLGLALTDVTKILPGCLNSSGMA